MGILFNQGIQFVFDATSRFVRASTPTFLRVLNYTETEEGAAVEVGVPYSPSGADTGFTDILIDPPPMAHSVTQKNMGMYGGRLNFGDKLFKISETFVHNQLQLPEMVAAGVTDGRAVFRNRDGKRCVGIVTGRPGGPQRVYSIDSITPIEASGAVVSWEVVGKGYETALTVNGGP